MEDLPIKREDGEQEAGTSPSGDVIQVSGNIVNSTIIIKSVVRDEQAVDLEKLPPEPGEPPYQGLQYFDEDDSERFFGREQLTARVIGRLQRTRFLAVIGASGSGKSSLIRAGVIPGLRSGERLVDGSLPPSDSPHWTYRTFTPGGHPLDALAAALSDPADLAALKSLREELARGPASLPLAVRALLAREKSPRLLLFIDQVEELFTQTRSEEERLAFINLLAAISNTEDPQPVSVLICLRADFYAQVARHDALRELVSQHQEFIGAMSRTELVDAIVGPLSQGDWKIQEGLVKVILRDVGYEPGALPLLSHALLETWKRRRGRTLTLSGYTESGGVDGAIRETAESVFRQRLTPDQQTIAKLIFLHLTEFNDEAQDTRRRAPFSELVTRASDEATIQAVINILTEARLVITNTVQPGDATVVEVAHESLIREWPTLREWLSEDRQGLILRRRLTEAAADWDKNDRDPGLLYRGRRLESIEAWAAKQGSLDTLNLQEAAFLEASRENARLEAEREAGLKRLRRNQRIFAGVIATLLVFVALLAWQGLRPKPPPQMGGLYNVAVAEFGELPADGGARPGTEGQAQPIADGSGLRASQQVAAALEASLQQSAGLLVWNDDRELEDSGVHIGVISNAAEAAAAAERLNAHMVIYGLLDRSTTPPSFKMEVYLAPRLSDSLDEVNGSFDLTAPVPVEGGLDAPAVQEAITQQADLLATLALAQSESQLGHTLEALELYLQAARLAPESSLVQFFIAREYLFSLEREPVLRFASEAFEEQARLTLEQALRLDPQNARARIGLGSLYIKQAKRLLQQSLNTEFSEAAFQQVMDLLGRAEAAYTAAQETDTQGIDYGVPVKDVAALGLGDARLTRGVAMLGFGQSAEAVRMLEQSAEMLKASLAAFQTPGLLRYQAQNHQFLGSAYENLGWLAAQQGDSPAALEYYRQALEQFQACIDIGSTSNDRVIQADIVESNCTPLLQETEQFMQQIGGS